MKKLVYGLAGLALLTSTAFAKDLEIFIKTGDRDHVIQVANKEAIKDYEGDIFFNYRREYNKWVLDRIIIGKDCYTRQFVRYVTKEEIPTYVDGIYSLYYDKDQDEENLVASFDDNVDHKVKLAWIDMAIKHIKELNES